MCDKDEPDDAAPDDRAAWPSYTTGDGCGVSLEDGRYLNAYFQTDRWPTGDAVTEPPPAGR